MYYLLEPRFQKDDAAPFWYVTPCADPREANMAWSSYKVHVLAGADELQKPSAPRASSSAENEVEDLSESSCEIPVLVNIKPLQASTHLRVFFQPPTSEKKPRAGPITVDQVQRKRARV